MRLCASLSRRRRGPAGLRCSVCNLVMLLFFHSARRAFHTCKRGCGITTLGAFHTVRIPCVAGYQSGKLCRFWVLAGGAPKERRKPSEQRCAHARRCSEASRPRWAAWSFFVSDEITACTPYSRNFFQFSRRSSLCCSCASCFSTRSFSARSCSRVFSFVIVLDPFS